MDTQLKKYVLLVFFLSVFIGSAHAVRPMKRYAKSYDAYTEAMRTKFYSIHVGSDRVNFFNPTFLSNIEDDKISQSFGANIGIEFRFYPFALECSMITNSFDMKNYSPIDQFAIFEEDSRTRLLGCNYFLNFNPSLGSGRFWKVVVPYVGVGYLSSALKVIQREEAESKTSSEESTISREVVASQRINSSMWKAGLHVNLVYSISLFGEYRQSFSLKDPMSLSNLSFGIEYLFME